MARQTRELWEARVRQWEASGLTAKQFAAETGLNHETLRHWKWHLGWLRRNKRNKQQGTSFVEVVAPLIAPSTPADAETFEVVLSHGIRVRVPMHFDAAALARLISALEGR